jgi:hypothetical protein
MPGAGRRLSLYFLKDNHVKIVVTGFLAENGSCLVDNAVRVSISTDCYPSDLNSDLSIDGKIKIPPKQRSTCLY